MPATTANPMKSLLQLNGAILLWGFTPLFAKVIDMHVVSLICLRSLIAALALLLLLFARHVPFRMKTRKDLLTILTSGILLAVHWVTYFYAIRVSTVAVGVIAICTTPMITIFIEPFFFREKLKKTDILTGLTVLIGVIILMPSFSLSSNITLGALFGIFSAACFALRGIISRKLVQTYDSTQIMFYQLCISFIIFTPYLLLNSPARFDTTDLWQLLLLGTAFTALSHTLFITSLTGLKAKTAGIMQAGIPVYSTLFAAIFIQEFPDLRTLTGGSIVLSAAIYESIKGRK